MDLPSAAAAGTRSRPALRAFAQAGLTAAAMIAIGAWAMQLRAAQPPVPLVWPAAGLGLALAWRLGPAAAVGVALGSAWLHAMLGTDAGPALLLGAFTGAAALVGAGLLRRLRFDARFSSVRDAILLLTVGAGVTAVVNAAGGALVVAGLTPEFAETFGLCWIADAIGLLLLGPPVLTFSRTSLGDGRDGERLFWLGLGAGFTWLVHGDLLAPGPALASSYAVFPLVMAVALRLDAATTTLVVAAVGTVALACTGLGSGPFARGALVADLLSLHAHLAMLALTGLLLACARRERDLAAARARDHLQTLARAGRLDAMSSLAAGIAHEINQPLSAVNAWAEAARRLLREGAEPAELGRAMDGIVAGNARAAEIVRRFRGFLGRSDGERERCDLDALAQDALGLVLPEYRRRRIGLESGRRAAALPVQADPVAIQQVIVNLLQNALEACAEANVPAPRVELTTQASDDGRFAELVLEDNGPGLPDADRRQLFDPLVTHREGGTGLGLAIVRSLVLAHDGEVEAGDAASGGARFRVRLPLAVAGRAAA